MANSAFLDFICQGDNLEVALDVSKKLEDFKLEMHKQFWKGLNSELRQRFNASKYTDEWKIDLHSAKAPKKNWAKTYFLLKKPNTGISLRIVLGQKTESIEYRLWLGVQWNKQPEEIDQTLLLDLRSYLTAQGITNLENGWVAWGETDYQLYRADNLRRLHQEPGVFIREIVDLYWNFIEETVPLISEFHKHLK